MPEQEHGEQDFAAEFESRRALDAVIGEYLADDKEFLDEHEPQDRIGAVYGMLLELGEDPDLILREAGLLTEEASDEV